MAIENRLVNMIKLLVNGFGMDVNETHDVQHLAACVP